MLRSAATRKSCVPVAGSSIDDLAAVIRSFPRRGQKAQGFTLIEVILVISLLVMMAALVLPNLFGWREAERIKNEGDNLRALLGGLRVRAIEEGSTITFSFESGQSSYRIAIESDHQPTSTGTSNNDAIIDFDSPSLFGDHDLPSGFAMYAGSRRPIRDTSKAPPIDSSAMTQKDARASIRFFPDGSATDGEVELVDQFGIGMTVRVNAISGIVTLSEIYNTGEKPMTGVAGGGRK